MKGSFLLKKRVAQGPKANIFANRSALLIHDLLLAPDDEFSVQAMARNTGLSVGLVHRVVSELINDGYVRVEGQRTAKKYRLLKRGALFRRWLEAYRLTDKCRYFPYETDYSWEELEKKLKSSRLSSSVVLSLHFACRSLGISYSTVETTELYLTNLDVRPKLEKLLGLKPCDRGYQVLLIAPYYSQIVEQRSEPVKGLLVTPPLLTCLDLNQFPYCGKEQFQHLLKRHPALKTLSRVRLA